MTEPSPEMLPSCTSTYTTKRFSIIPKRLLATPPSADKAELKIYLGELKNDGCMSEIGGVMWEASVILCCYILTNSKTF
eukprot:CAMPEP_0114472938 /NCGR_PEP_ID=MMETSP0104-20121206/12676_1 /TAXON_ID=37642 ORGANISM="Paraphysomonas imperforata, Strain PA2" /NCGR_SAMPLE_ID=MMETSP0104 /ASSEMBLY_ACC=CAM_ASM_000202 /LENGTH=78 /DNA_ID=CAMNT_0001647011 /DNA_START=124 /DNA_END=357 /DNA_ORIENTATION=+